MDLTSWSTKWNIPLAAMDDLKKSITGEIDLCVEENTMQSEAAVLNLVRLEAIKSGARLWRNNLGAVHTADGRFLRYGLANESSAVNAKIKSADLIGIRPIKITEAMVGTTIGQFLSREIKKPGWKYAGTEREKAQLAWAKLILAFGGDAAFANCEGTL